MAFIGGCFYLRWVFTGLGACRGGRRNKSGVKTGEISPKLLRLKNFQAHWLLLKIGWRKSLALLFALVLDGCGGASGALEAWSCQEYWKDVLIPPGVEGKC